MASTSISNDPHPPPAAGAAPRPGATGPLAEVGALIGLEGPGIERVDVVAGPDVWRGPLPLDDLAAGLVAAALAALSELHAGRTGSAAAGVVVERRHAAASFLAEGLVEPQGWTLPPVWDPIAGDYLASDGWIRLHTNYGHHRRAALRALELADRPDLGRDAVAAAVAGWWADALEQAVVDAGGVAAAQRAEGAWWHTDAGAAVRAEPLVALTTRAAAGRPLGRLAAEALPLTGVRVLDLTRVLAGPVCTGFLAAWGADVLRIDPPDFDEVPAVVPVTTAGKRTARLDLASAAGREQLLALVAEADIVVHGYRSDALAKLGAGPERWCEVRPDLVEVALDAYGWTGPWRHRRGFDSLVQHTSGITAIGQAAAGAERPVPMPCQALDHGCGWLLGASAVAGLARRARTGAGTSARVSLARLASWLVDQPCSGDPQRPAPTLDDLGPYLTVAPTAWGPLRRLAWPGRLGDLLPAMGRSVPIGAGAARW